MFNFLKKHRPKSAHTLSKPNTAKRQRLFEALETRRVLDAEGVAVDMVINIDAEYAPPTGYYVPGQNVVVDAEMFITTSAEDGATVKFLLYPDSGDDWIFTEGSDEFFNEYVEEGTTPIVVHSFTRPANSGVHAVSDYTFSAPAQGNYWLVMSISDGVNHAIERFGGRLEVYGTATATIESITGVAVPGATLTVEGSAGAETSFTGNWLVTADFDNDTVFETLIAFESGANDAAISFVPTAAGNYRVQFETSSASGTGFSSQDFEVFESITSEDGVTSIGVDAGGVEFIVTAPLDATSIVVYGQAGSDIITLASSITVPVTINSGGGDDVITIDPSITAPVTVYGGAGNDIITTGAAVSLFSSFASTLTTTPGFSYVVIDGGAGDDIVVGGSGTDIITGGTGRDIIIGGAGSDLLIGNGGDDLLITGSVSLDTAALQAIRSLWTASGSFSARVSSVLANSQLGSSVQDDNAVDLVLGGGGNDWLFANFILDGVNDLPDLVLDLSLPELLRYRELQ